MKIKIIKFLISKNGYYDREMLIHIVEKLDSYENAYKRFLRKIIRKGLKAWNKAMKPKVIKPVILTGGEIFWINYSKNKFFPKDPFFKKLKRKYYAK